MNQVKHWLVMGLLFLGQSFFCEDGYCQTPRGQGSIILGGNNNNDNLIYCMQMQDAFTQCEDLCREAGSSSRRNSGRGSRTCAKKVDVTTGEGESKVTNTFICSTVLNNVMSTCESAQQKKCNEIDVELNKATTKCNDRCQASVMACIGPMGGVSPSGKGLGFLAVAGNSLLGASPNGGTFCKDDIYNEAEENKKNADAAEEKFKTSREKLLDKESDNLKRLKDENEAMSKLKQEIQGAERAAKDSNIELAKILNKLGKEVSSGRIQMFDRIQKLKTAIDKALTSEMEALNTKKRDAIRKIYSKCYESGKEYAEKYVARNVELEANGQVSSNSLSESLSRAAHGTKAAFRNAVEDRAVMKCVGQRLVKEDIQSVLENEQDQKRAIADKVKELKDELQKTQADLESLETSFKMDADLANTVALQNYQDAMNLYQAKVTEYYNFQQVSKAQADQAKKEHDLLLQQVGADEQKKVYYEQFKTQSENKKNASGRPISAEDAKNFTKMRENFDEYVGIKQNLAAKCPDRVRGGKVFDSSLGRGRGRDDR